MYVLVCGCLYVGVDACLDLVCEGSRHEAASNGRASVTAANFRLGHWPMVLEVMALSSTGFLVATIA